MEYDFQSQIFNIFQYMPSSGLMSLQLNFCKICIHYQLSFNALTSIDVKSFDVIPRGRSICWIAIAPSGCNCSVVESLCSFPSESRFLQGTSVDSTLLLWLQFWHSASQYLLDRTMHVWLKQNKVNKSRIFHEKL